ncbi:MAG TPA: hypothetical protein VNP98_03535 [Chthoniobacterales bacterium]|nr:hypothetical protein [Chthoniobacterales bacterium]
MILADIIGWGIAALLTAIGGVVFALGRELLTDTAAKLIKNHLPAIRPRFFRTRNHLAQLRASAEELPFIYKDLKGDISHDFVDPSVTILDPQTLTAPQPAGSPTGRPHPTEPLHDELPLNERLRRFRKILILGSAGVGKTTFQRHAILGLIDKHAGGNFTNRAEDSIPVFVPLNAVDNYRRHPILRYIFDNVLLFKGKTKRSALAALRRLAESGKLFLFLDGFDEMPLPGSEDFIRQELDWLFLPDRDRKAPAIYRSLSRCRVWVSSRLDFFMKNKFAGIGLPQGLHPVSVLQISGIKERATLVQTIFEKFRVKDQNWDELLNEEYFLFVLDNARDNEVRELSWNPLFLMVMCYVYAERAQRSGTPQVPWLDTFHDLINECVSLLLRELDLGKATHLRGAAKNAFATRRNEYFDEKREFLPFFAFTLFKTGLPLFIESVLKERAREFFRHESRSPNTEAILANLDSRGGFARQLINSDLFRLSAPTTGRQRYDFLHQHFREVLAAQYISTAERYLELLEQSDRPQFPSLIKVLRNMPHFACDTFQDASLRVILDYASTNTYSDARRINCAREFITSKPDNYDPASIVVNFLRDQLSRNEPHFITSSDLLPDQRPPNWLIESATNAFDEAVTQGQPKRLSLACAILLQWERHFLSERLSKAARNTPVPTIRAVLVQYALECCPKLLCDDWDRLVTHSDMFVQLSFAASQQLQLFSNITPFFECAPKDHWDLFAALLAQFRNGTALHESLKDDSTKALHILSHATVRRLDQALLLETLPLQLTKDVVVESESDKKANATKTKACFETGHEAFKLFDEKLKLEVRALTYRMFSAQALKKYLPPVIAAATELLSDPTARRLNLSFKQMSQIRSMQQFESSINSLLIQESIISASTTKRAAELIRSYPPQPVIRFFA